MFHLNNPDNARRFHEHFGSPVGDIKKLLPNHFKAPFASDLERDMANVKLASKKLSRLVRYERRAANKRDKAFRELEQMKTILLYN